jgi:hypothetical protein
VQEVDGMKTPGGGICRKKSRLERKEALFKKKRARSALNKTVQSVDLGLYPPDTVGGRLNARLLPQDSSDDGLFTGTVWWESTDQVEADGSGQAKIPSQGDGGGEAKHGADNPAFLPDTPAPAPAPAPASAPAPAPAPPKIKIEGEETDP